MSMSKQAKIAELEADNARLKKIASGELNSEKGQPIGNSRIFTREQIANMSIEDYRTNKPDIDKALAAGNIK